MPLDYNIVTDRAAFFDQLDLAIAKTKKLISENPSWEMLHSFARQLDAMKQWSANGRKPAFDERKSITMGRAAQREIQGTNDMEWYDYMQQITELDSYFKFWRSDAGLSTLDTDDYRTSFPADYDFSDE
jgi:hypothetical protein